MTVDADEDLLNEVLCLLPVSDCAVDEVQEARLITLHELLEGTFFPAKEGRDDLSVIHRAQLFAVIDSAMETGQRVTGPRGC